MVYKKEKGSNYIFACSVPGDTSNTYYKGGMVCSQQGETIKWKGYTVDLWKYR